MKSIKKITAFAAACMCAVMSLSACGQEAEPVDDGIYDIGICQLVQHDALDAATNGFKDAVNEKLGADKVRFHEEIAAGDAAVCSNICAGFVENNYDLIMANATPALQAAASATDSIPIIGTSITDYATALDIQDWTGKTGKNISGSCDLAPISEVENVLVEIVPTASTVAVVYSANEPNSKYQATLFEDELKADGISFVEYAVADESEIVSKFEAATAECDALYVPTDNMIAANTDKIADTVINSKKPLIAGESNICKSCGVATLSIDYYDIGYYAGQIAVSCLKSEKNPGDVNIQYATKIEKQYNAEICEQLGITAPENYVAIS